MYVYCTVYSIDIFTGEFSLFPSCFLHTLLYTTVNSFLQVIMNSKLLHVGIVLCLLSRVSGSDSSIQDEEDEDLNYYLNLLYNEADDNIDLHDMLAYPGQPKENSRGRKEDFRGGGGRGGLFGSGYWTGDEGTDAINNKGW